MKIDEYRTKFPDRRKPVPLEYAGLWISWNDDLTEILSSGKDVNTVREQAALRGCAKPVLQKIPRGPFVGRI
jgi:hypothetical protein